MAERHGRSLTAGEIAVARRIFSDGLDYARVKIYRGIPLLPALNVAVAPGNTVFFPRRNCPDDLSILPQHQLWLIHELTHVWQHQSGYKTWLGGLLLAVRGGYWRRSAYVYPPLPQIAALADLNMEQQADLMAHYYAARYLDWPQYRNQLPQLQALLGDFLREPRNTAWLPRDWAKCSVSPKAKRTR